MWLRRSFENSSVYRQVARLAAYKRGRWASHHQQAATYNKSSTTMLALQITPRPTPWFTSTCTHIDKHPLDTRNHAFFGQHHARQPAASQQPHTYSRLSQERPFECCEVSRTHHTGAPTSKSSATAEAGVLLQTGHKQAACILCRRHKSPKRMIPAAAATRGGQDAVLLGAQAPGTETTCLLVMMHPLHSLLLLTPSPCTHTQL